MEENNIEERSQESPVEEVLDIKDLEEVNSQSMENDNPDLSNIISNLFSKDKILPILLFTLFAKEEKKGIQSNWSDQLKGVLSKAENILDIMYALDGYTKKQSVFDNVYNEEDGNAQKKVIEVLEVIRPHVRGEGREKIDQALMVNDRIDRLKENSKEKKDVIKNFENITDILEILEFKEGHEIRKVLNKAKDIIDVMKR